MKQQTLNKISRFILVLISTFIFLGCKNSLEYSAITYEYGDYVGKDACLIKDYPESGYVTILAHPGDYGLNTVTITKIYIDSNGIYLKDVHRDNTIHVPYYLEHQNDTLIKSDLSFRNISKDSADFVSVYPNFLCDTLLRLDSPKNEVVYIMVNTDFNVDNKAYRRYFFKDYHLQNIDSLDLQKLELKESVQLFGFTARGMSYKQISKKDLDKITKGFRKNIK